MLGRFSRGWYKKNQHFSMDGHRLQGLVPSVIGIEEITPPLKPFFLCKGQNRKDSKEIHKTVANVKLRKQNHKMRGISIRKTTCKGVSQYHHKMY